MWTMKRFGAAPCQCFSPGSKNTRSPGRISSTGPPSRWQRPTPSVTKIVWPCGRGGEGRELGGERRRAGRGGDGVDVDVAREPVGRALLGVDAAARDLHEAP